MSWLPCLDCGGSLCICRASRERAELLAMLLECVQAIEMIRPPIAEHADVAQRASALLAKIRRS